MIKDFEKEKKYSDKLDGVDLHTHAIEKTPWSKKKMRSRKEKRNKKTYLFTCSHF